MLGLGHQWRLGMRALEAASRSHPSVFLVALGVAGLVGWRWVRMALPGAGAGSAGRRPRPARPGASHAHSLLYDLYMRSPLWRARRRVWIWQARGRCQGCGRTRSEAGGPLTIHHKTYARLGHERRSDVRVLCWACHQQTDWWRFHR